ncbi:M36 family metallopeptidase [Myxococcota bacterium]|nr:M36 family metallopeptidase [Myxococcota bacterium]
MKHIRSQSRGLVSLLVAGAVGCQGQEPTPSAHNPKTATKATTLAPSTPRALAAKAGGYVASADARGTPNFIWGRGQAARPGDSIESAARYHLARYASAYGVSAEVLDAAETKAARQLRSGATLVKVGQRASGVEVYPSEANVLMRSNLELVAISGNLRRLGHTNGAADFSLAHADALAGAIQKHLGVAFGPEDLITLNDQRGDWRRFVSAAGAPAFVREAQVKQIYHAVAEVLEPAYFVEFYAGHGHDGHTDAFRYILSARDGRVLESRNLTANDAFQYRVWASPTDLRPFDGPIADVTPNPSGVPDGLVPGFIPSNLVSVEGFNTNPSGGVDPWLDATATQTFGNNVDAYSDHDDPDGYSNGDLRATTTGPQTFDRNFDVNADPLASDDQTMASVTSLFYVNNWLHNYWYDSGFDELAGNAQFDNFGRGGIAGDVLHAEAQDGVLLGRRNNANMSTPSDGMSPRMQMYSWTGNEHVTLHVEPLGLDLAWNTAAFGATTFNVTADLVVANDGVGATADGCTPFQNNVSGQIAIVDRGTCTFVVKAANAQAAGAVGVIIADNRPAAIPPGMGGADPSITIGVLSVLQADGNMLKAALLNGPVTATMTRFTDPDRDGSLDYMVVAHEWGHYIHNRLADCGSIQCRGQGEGWGDFLSLHTMLRDGDSLDGVYSAAIYATLSGNDPAYFGIRRVPYSTDFEKNALTFRHIQDGEPLPTSHPLQAFGPNSEVHNTGEVWATMMWQAYTAVQRTGQANGRTFDQSMRRMSDYVVAGLMMTPRDSTFTEARDAIIAAAMAIDANDARAVATAFAIRGNGSCAVAPERGSVDNVGVVEGYDLKPTIRFEGLSFVDDLRSCDHDGQLDADERGTVVLTVSNGGPVETSSTTLMLAATHAGITFPAGATIAVPALGPYSSATVSLQIALDPTLATTATVGLGISVMNPEACATTVTSTVFSRVNLDEVAGLMHDDVESPSTAWTVEGLESDVVWSRPEITTFDRAWFGLNLGGVSDTMLTSPTLHVSTSTSFVMMFDHRYSFEADTTYWDGAVIELSPDDGQTWNDISMYADPGYGGTITDVSGNPLALRQAFVASNAAWPAREHFMLDLGSQLAGQAIKIRFRIGTDLSASFYGWELDNLAFHGITNAPFYGLGDDATLCPPEVMANAGLDLVDVAPGAIVTLDGSGSAAGFGQTLTYTWRQTSGPAVTLTGVSSMHPQFVAPGVDGGATVSFELTVSDGVSSASDSVDVAVLSLPTPVLVANAGVDVTATANQVVVLDATGSSISTFAPLTFAWRQLSGPAVTLTGADRSVASFVAPRVETNTVISLELTVTSGSFTATDVVDVTVQGFMLSASAGADQTVDPRSLVVLDATGSTVTGNETLTFEWTQESGPSVTITDATSAVARFTAPDVSTMTTLVFKVAARTSAFVSEDTVSIAVRPVAITAVAGDDLSVGYGALVVLNGTESTSSIGLPLTHTWTQVDGPSVSLERSGGSVASFTAPKVDAETKLVFELTVSDGTRMATDSVEITVGAYEAPALTASAGLDSIVSSGQQAVLDGSKSASAGGLPLTFQWTQKSGTSVTLTDASSAVARFTAPDVTADAVLTFEVSVSDGDQTLADTVSVTVKPPVVADDGGCGCTTTDAEGTTSTAGSLSALAFGAALMFLRRRRRV